MSLDKYYDEILQYITEHGETGVNILAKELNLPLSTMQRYLERQTYFRKTINRKWDLPDNVESDIKSNTMTLMIESVENAVKLLNSQLDEIQSNVQNALMPISTLKRAVNSLNTPVAGNSDEVTPIMIDTDKKIKTTYTVFKKYKDRIPEGYTELILNVDMHRLTVEMGTIFTNADFSTDISSLLLGQIDELPEDTIEILKEYQKEQK